MAVEGLITFGNSPNTKDIVYNMRYVKAVYYGMNLIWRKTDSPEPLPGILIPDDGGIYLYSYTAPSTSINLRTFTLAGPSMGNPGTCSVAVIHESGLMVGVCDTQCGQATAFSDEDCEKFGVESGYWYDFELSTANYKLANGAHDYIYPDGIPLLPGERYYIMGALIQYGEWHSFVYQDTSNYPSYNAATLTPGNIIGNSYTADVNGVTRIPTTSSAAIPIGLHENDIYQYTGPTVYVWGKNITQFNFYQWVTKYTYCGEVDVLPDDPQENDMYSGPFGDYGTTGYVAYDGGEWVTVVRNNWSAPLIPVIQEKYTNGQVTNFSSGDWEYKNGSRPLMKINGEVVK